VLPYLPGTGETDLPLKEAIVEDQVATVYFNDGVIMLVKILTHVQKDNGETIEAIRGFIAYSVIQHTRTSIEESLQVVSKEVYQALFGTTEPRKIGT